MALDPSAVFATGCPASANTPEAAATIAIDTQDAATTCPDARSGVSSPRESGTEETSAIEVAVTATSSEAMR